MKLKVRKEINPDKNTIWIIQHDYNLEVYQEDENGPIEIEIEPFKGRLTKWYYGVKNKQYYTAIAAAYECKLEELVLNVPNIVISIEQDKDDIIIFAGIYAENEKTATALAYKFINGNKFIKFSLEPEPKRFPLRIDVIRLIDSLLTVPIAQQENQNEQVVVKDAPQEKKTLQIFVSTPEPGIYAQKDDGNVERVAINIFGDMYDYVDINIQKIKSHFYGAQSVPINIDLLKDIVKERFKNDGMITAQDMEMVTGVPSKVRESCKIFLIYKSDAVKDVVNLLRKYTYVDESRATKIIKDAINLASKDGTGITTFHIMSVLKDEEKELFEKIQESVMEVMKEEDTKLESTKDVNKVLVISKEKKAAEVIVFGLLLRAKREKQVVELINV